MLRERDTKHYYEITFRSRPLHITLTSSQNNIDGYITSFEKDCPIVDIKKKLTLNSKVIKVNDVLVEGCEVTEIARHLSNESLPIKLVLAHPEGLEGDELPDLDPETIVHMQATE